MKNITINEIVEKACNYSHTSEYSEIPASDAIRILLTYIAANLDYYLVAKDEDE